MKQQIKKNQILIILGILVKFPKKLLIKKSNRKYIHSHELPSPQNFPQTLPLPSNPNARSKTHGGKSHGGKSHGDNLHFSPNRRQPSSHLCGGYNCAFSSRTLIPALMVTMAKSPQANDGYSSGKPPQVNLFLKLLNPALTQ
ncbi:hypothetical protein HanXRQr2_Chr03g0104601 [Helianthus annuus]|uniref:Uncharacterized protein n=1 Tax=Helianthus annuus TaxID=4232 RepID=A0A251V553_HELAN|nr:hypothetical protein HanXRQr2_Chr03g0104601 [Helianthus annuus]KAJ0592615.1 hypothetical protein HanHA300_Chr03g0087191 [Helianthus annuus]KAJ0607611.1 hypothetical protein HanHA89_Chr03g0098771 [Helianthus annuus]KAJ0767674.1 hypothetical protein HanLR1_Chr03g0092121 [Helianthus annuus]KAJ0943182.1 hypothetical protein HanPSC8_Chr03g0101031 [Helianthus annuus]